MRILRVLVRRRRGSSIWKIGKSGRIGLERATDGKDKKNLGGAPQTREARRRRTAVKRHPKFTRGNFYDEGRKRGLKGMANWGHILIRF